MKILIVSATHFEIEQLLTFLEIKETNLGLHTSKKHPLITVLITGIGMVNTAFMMGKYMQTFYDFVLNVGVCGAFNKTIELGQIVNVTQDVLSELGAEDGEDFLSYDKLNLDGQHIFNNKTTGVNTLKKVIGITVNTIHGNELSIKKIIELYNPDVESMEGAAFFSSCNQFDGQYIQIRAISNYVEKRDKSKWQMPLAINNLNTFVINFIQLI